MEAKITLMPIIIQRRVAVQWISVEFMSDAVMQGRNAASQLVHTAGSTDTQRSPYSNKSLPLAEPPLTVPEVVYGMSEHTSGTEGGVVG